MHNFRIQIIPIPNIVARGLTLYFINRQQVQTRAHTHRYWLLLAFIRNKRASLKHLLVYDSENRKLKGN